MEAGCLRRGAGRVLPLPSAGWQKRFAAKATPPYVRFVPEPDVTEWSARRRERPPRAQGVGLRLQIYVAFIPMSDVHKVSRH